MNIYSRFEAAFRAANDAPALVGPHGDSMSYAGLLVEVELMAVALASRGVVAGDRVLVQVAKTPQAVALYLACLKIGAVYAPINPAYTQPEVEHFIADAEPALFVAGKPIGVATAMETLDDAGYGTLPERAAAATPMAATTPRGDDDLAALIYTSGTTGRPKGAAISHGNLLSNAETLARCWGWRSDDVLLHALPIFHVHGLFVALHCSFLAATPTIFLPRFDLPTILAELPHSTVMMGVPTFYARLLGSGAFDADACAGMRLFISGSAPLSEQTFAEFERRTGCRILERYGMSETLMNASNPLDGERVAGSVGFALPGVGLRIADDRGQPLPNGAIGGVEVRGPNVFKGYWRMPERTAAEFRSDGFFITGDLGRMDADGRLTLVGRSKDLVISGGCNIYPKEVEALLDELPGVAESAVIGVPHADFGEAVVAIVVADEAVGEPVVDAYLKNKLARYKQPKRIVRVDALPRNAMGKVQKNMLRQQYWDILAD